MAVKLVNLQLIYGVAGAREKFEDLASQLVKGEQPRAAKVRIVHGDGGIDVHVGELTNPSGIDVFQCKFFPKGLGDIQKGQIRESFKTCRDSTDFRTKKWTLCLPVDLSVDEKKWFEDWRSKQAASGIVIEDVWGAMKLEGLLYQENNRELRESFFKVEHLRQIRETHGLVQTLVNRTEDNEQQAKRTAELSRQADYVKEFVDAHCDYYLSAVHQVASSYNPPETPPSHWEVVIRPSWIPEQPRIDTLNACWSVVNNAKVRSNGWEYPVIRMDRQNEADWVGATHTSGLHVESWRFSQSGVFVHAFPIWDEIGMRGRKLDHWPWILPGGSVPERYLDLDNALRMVTHVFRFASKLAEKAFDPADETVEVTIRLLGTRDRVLIAWNDPRRLSECCRATASHLENMWNCARTELLSAPDRLAIRTAVWFFERFNWANVSSDVLAQDSAGTVLGALLGLTETLWRHRLPTHPLHQAIGCILDHVHHSLPDDRRGACVVIKDPACISGSSPHYLRVPQNIPLFCSMVRSNATEYCNVDALILLGGRIKVIVEIEESALDPTQVFGKFLTSATALCYIHDADGAAPVVKDERTLFVQLMDTSDLKPRSTKRDQWNNIQSSIRSLLPLGSVSEYHLIHGDENDFLPGQPLAQDFARCVTTALGAVGVADGSRAGQA